jgi:acyl-CoA oxidase
VGGTDYGRDQANRVLGFDTDDILSLTARFWEMHMDGIVITDIGSLILLSIQYNLVAGTIAPFARERADLQHLMKKIMNFDVS